MVTDEWEERRSRSDLCKHALTVFPIANPYEVLGLLQGARASLDLDLILSASLLADLHGISDIHWRRRQNVVGFYYSTHCRASGFFCRCSLSGQPLLPHECLVRLGPSGSCCLREMTTDVRPECLDCCGGSAGASAAGAAADYATGLPGCACRCHMLGEYIFPGPRRFVPGFPLLPSLRSLLFPDHSWEQLMELCAPWHT